MTPAHESDSALKPALVTVIIGVGVMIVLDLTTSAGSDDPSGRGNSALLLLGSAAVAVSGVVLLALGKRIDRATMVLILTLAITGMTAVSLVDFEALGQTGLYLSAPLAVPIILGFVRFFRNR